MKHKEITAKDYYDKYIKKENDGKCLMCGKPTNFTNMVKGYNRWCSLKCMSSDPQIQKKKENTCMKNHGVKSPMQNKDINDKRKQTNVERYGSEELSQSSEIRSKMTKTLRKTYKDNSDEIIAKRKLTNLKRYGTISPMELKEILDKRRQTNLKKYGTKYPIQLKSIQDKRKETYNKKYGISNPMEDDTIKHKWMIQVYKHKIDKLNDMIKAASDSCIFPNSIDDMIEDESKRIWKCKSCGKVNQFKHFSLDIFRCNCNKENLLERDFRLFLESLGVPFIQHDNKKIKPFELDFYLPKYKIAIELNGLYWHSEKVLAMSESDLVSESFQNKQSKFTKRHYNKFQLCKSKQIRLIQIFEDEWINKREIVMSRIKHIFQLDDKIIYARKCVIRTIESNVKNEFLNDNHLQGSDRSSIKYGAFYNDELVAVMTFATPNRSKGGKFRIGIWELSRFAIKKNYSVVGIANKLFKHFIKNNEFKEIFSYCDLRWSEGNVYKQLGFKFDKWTGLGYWYTDFCNRFHRFGLRKNSDDPENIPEWILRWSEGLYRVWDCGNYKYILKRENV